jgi:hypothetical protein
VGQDIPLAGWLCGGMGHPLCGMVSATEVGQDIPLAGCFQQLVLAGHCDHLVGWLHNVYRQDNVIIWWDRTSRLRGGFQLQFHGPNLSSGHCGYVVGWDVPLAGCPHNLYLWDNVIMQ